MLGERATCRTVGDGIPSGDETADWGDVATEVSPERAEGGSDEREE